MKKKLYVSTDLALPVDWMTMATVVYGARGAGKTTFGAVVAEELHKVRQRFCAIDLKGDLWGLKATADGRGEGIPVVIFGGDHADLPLEEGAGKFLGELVASLEQSVVLDLEHLSKGKQVRFLSEFFSALYDKNRKPLLVIADEAQRYAPQKPASPDAHVCLGAVEDLVKLGRKHGIGVLLLTQRGAGLNKEVSEICDMMVVFRTPGALDQQRVRDWLEANGGDTKQLDYVSGFGNGVALVVSAHPDLKLSKYVLMRRRETFDSSATPRVGERRRVPKRLAQPQLEAIKARMADAMQRLEENDAGKLKQTIKALQARLAKGSMAPGYVAIEKSALDALKVAATKKVKEPPRVEVIVIKEKDVKEFEAACAKMQKKLDEHIEELKPYQKRLNQATESILSKMAAAVAQGRMTVPVPPRVAKAAKTFMLGDAHTTHTTKAQVRKERQQRKAVEGEAKLKKGAYQMLQHLAVFEEKGLSRSQLATMTRIKPSGSTFTSYLSTIRRPGFIRESGDQVYITDAGLAHIGDDRLTTPTTTAELVSMWKGRIAQRGAETSEPVPPVEEQPQ